MMERADNKLLRGARSDRLQQLEDRRVVPKHRRQAAVAMDYLEIHGGQSLEGQVKISGAKNATLPLIAATLLTEETVHLRRVPHRLVDVQTMTRLLVGLGCEATQRSGGRFDLTTPVIEETTASYDLVRTMRASVLVLGPLLARHGEARVSLPGGCAIGARPVDQHLKAMERLGAKIELEGGYVVAKAPRGCAGTSSLTW